MRPRRYACPEPERDADRERQQHRRERQLDGRWQALGDDVEDGAAMEEAATEITMRGAPGEGREALDDGQIEAHIMAQRRDLLGRGALIAEHDLNGIAGRRQGHREGDERGSKQHRQEVQEPLQKAHPTRPWRDAG